MKKYIVVLSVLLLAASCGKPADQQNPGQSGQPEQAAFDGKLRIDSPKEGDSIAQSFTVTGMAQNWFEGTISAAVYDNQGHQVYSGSFTVPDNYEQPAQFSQSITLTARPWVENGWAEFTDYSAKDGSVTYRRVVQVKFSEFGQDTALSNTYQSPQKDGFSFKYPSDFGFQTDYSHITLLGYIPVCDQVMAACAYYAGEAYKGTNFEGAGVSVNLLREFSTEAKCYNFKVSTSETQEEVASVSIGGAQFRSATGGGGAAGHFDRAQSYRNFHNGVCYEIVQRVSGTNIGVYTPGTVTEFNQDEIWQRLTGIVQSFQFTGSAAQSPSAPSGQLTVTGTTVCLPHKNVKPGDVETLECALGLKDSTSGKYYGLKNSPQPIFDVNVKVKATGTLETDTDGKYDVVGNIAVSSIVKL